MNVAYLSKVKNGPNLVTPLKWTSIIEWCMDLRTAFKRACVYKISNYVSKFVNNLGSTVNIIVCVCEGNNETGGRVM